MIKEYIITPSVTETVIINELIETDVQPKKNNECPESSTSVSNGQLLVVTFDIFNVFRCDYVKIILFLLILFLTNTFMQPTDMCFSESDLVSPKVLMDSMTSP